MGANAQGVVIGNEGVHARLPAQQEPALIGMDLVRLGLERSSSAAEALDVVTELLERHGQGGNCGHLEPAYYHNSFIIADGHEAWVLETIGRDWLAERVASLRSISNRYTIAQPDRASVGIETLAGPGPVSDYSEALADPKRQHIGSAMERRARANKLLETRSGALTVADMIGALRDHGSVAAAGVSFDPHAKLVDELCIHARIGSGSGQTTGSLVSEINSDGGVHWVTGAAAPCLSVFRPVLFGAALPECQTSLTDRFDAGTRWWSHEVLHRKALTLGLDNVLPTIVEERDSLEAAFRGRINAVLVGGTKDDLTHVVASCWQEADALERLWCQRLGPPKTDASPFGTTWAEMNRMAGLQL